MNEWTEIRDRCVLLEDEAILVLNKPPGISVMGERHETDLVRLAQEAGESLLPVHRIDKVTSGAVLFAKDLRIHGGLTRQFNRRSVEKAYLAIVRGDSLPGRGVIDLPLSVGRKNRVRIGAPRESIVADIGADGAAGTWTVPAAEVFEQARTYPSVTMFAKVLAAAGNTLVAVRPVTGRRHQIRVHLAWIGSPIAGDPLFERGAAGEGRTHLHSWRLEFDAAWLGGERVTVEAPPGADFWAPAAARPDGAALGDAGPDDAAPDDAGPDTVLARARRAIADLVTREAAVRAGAGREYLGRT